MAELVDVLRLFKTLGSEYGKSRFDLSLIPPIVESCYSILEAQCRPRRFDDLVYGREKKEYWVFERISDEQISRPFRAALFIFSYQDWLSAWHEMVATISPSSRTMIYGATDEVLYSAAIAFFSIIDLFKRNSRKINGTFLEYMLGTLLAIVSGLVLSHSVGILDKIEREESETAGDESAAWGGVPTDIVLTSAHQGTNLVFPVKTSTRERISQVFAHQRILDTFNPGEYRSALLAVSECQLIERTRKKTKYWTVQETCVPAQVNLYEKCLAHIDAFYYLDPPFRYVEEDLSVPVRTIRTLFSADLAELSGNKRNEPAGEACGQAISVCALEKQHAGAHRPLSEISDTVSMLRLAPSAVGDAEASRRSINGDS